MAVAEASKRSTGWMIGWAGGAGVVVIAAALLLTIIALARRITVQAGEIVAGLDGAERHTRPLWNLADVNATLSRMVDRPTSAPERDVP